MAQTLVFAIYLFSEVITAAMLIQAILSWFVRDRYSPLGKLYMLLSNFTEPLVAPCRRLLSRVNTGMLDFSLLLALILLQVITNILIRLVYFIF
ncbi:MAG: YggT family protein [Firmicutes bacterium]|nr:YggT family protein [Bacillota bacterium]